MLTKYHLINSIAMSFSANKNKHRALLKKLIKKYTQILTCCTRLNKEMYDIMDLFT